MNFKGSPAIHIKILGSSLFAKDSRGGLSSRAMHHQNITLLSKLSWEMLQGYDKPHLQLLNMRYLKHSHFLGHVPPASCSFFWQGIWKTKDLLRKGVLYEVGSGHSIDIWTDPWLLGAEHTLPQPASSLPPNWKGHYQRVSQLIQDRITWDTALLLQLFDSATVELITANVTPNPTWSDKVTWMPNSNGIFSVSKAYMMSKSDEMKGLAKVHLDRRKPWRSHIH